MQAEGLHGRLLDLRAQAPQVQAGGLHPEAQTLEQLEQLDEARGLTHETNLRHCRTHVQGQSARLQAPEATAEVADLHSIRQDVAFAEALDGLHVQRRERGLPQGIHHELLLSWARRGVHACSDTGVAKLDGAEDPNLGVQVLYRHTVDSVWRRTQACETRTLALDVASGSLVESEAAALRIEPARCASLDVGLGAEGEYRGAGDGCLEGPRLVAEAVIGHLQACKGRSSIRIQGHTRPLHGQTEGDATARHCAGTACTIAHRLVHLWRLHKALAYVNPDKLLHEFLLGVACGEKRHVARLQQEVLRRVHASGLLVRDAEEAVVEQVGAVYEDAVRGVALVPLVAVDVGVIPLRHVPTLRSHLHGKVRAS
mmetsp:Transcript_59492/g.184565  ORF Transcript_59492/g.184565 Transcript_59492/m.184565 type:complete len:370 (+) Transcript_59492:1641-2750(+)